MLCTHEQVHGLQDLSVNVEIGLGRFDLVDRGLEDVGALGAGGLDADHGLVGGHVVQLDPSLGVASRDGRVHGVDIDGGEGGDVVEKSLSHCEQVRRVRGLLCGCKMRGGAMERDVWVVLGSFLDLPSQVNLRNVRAAVSSCFAESVH